MRLNEATLGLSYAETLNHVLQLFRVNGSANCLTTECKASLFLFFVCYTSLLRSIVTIRRRDFAFKHNLSLSSNILSQFCLLIITIFNSLIFAVCD